MSSVELTRGTARQGCTVVIPFREEMAKRHLKVTGDLGRVVFIEYDLRNTESIEQSVRHSDVVYNLVGRNYPTKYAMTRQRPKGRIAKTRAGTSPWRTSTSREPSG